MRTTLRDLALLSTLLLGEASGCGSVPPGSDAGVDVARLDAPVNDATPADTSLALDAPDALDAPAPIDAPDARDAPPDDAPSPSVPRPIAPLSTATVTTRRPTLRWELGPGTDGARVELCASRACTSVLETIDVVGTSAVPTVELPAGVVFWRLRGRAGSTTSAATSPTWQFHVGARSAPIDTSWGSILDVNGDGYADVAVGAPDVNAVYVHLGGAAGLGPAPAWSQTIPAPSVRASGFGGSVASAGDVDGDGYAELIVGADAECIASVCDGAAYVFPGGPTGLATTPAWVLTVSGALNFGRSVASAGDVNGDGFGDVAVGADRTSAVFVYLGGGSGLESTPSSTRRGAEGESFGISVAGAGDVDGDGHGDVVVGAIFASSGTATGGAAYLYRGGPTGLGEEPAWTQFAARDFDAYGISVACAGDVDGDGYADVVVGAHQQPTGNGTAYVYRGGATGVAAAASWTFTPSSGVELFGRSVAGAGDVDGDGYADLIVGAYFASFGEGAAYVFLGGATGLRATPAWRGTGRSADWFGYAVAGAGDVDGDGHADVVIGATHTGFPPDGEPGAAHLHRGSPSGIEATPAWVGTGPRSGYGTSVASARASVPIAPPT